MKNIAVYTIILGDYDEANALLDIYKDDNIDYYFITNCKDAHVPGYTMIYIDLIKTNINTYSFYKNKIPDFIRAYKYSIYYDGNVTVTKKLGNLINYVNDSDVAITISPMLLNVYYHYFLFLKKNIIYKKHYDKYIDDGWTDNGINVNTKFVIRKHSERLFKFCDLWYTESYNQRNYADELSLLYCVYKSNVKLYKIMNLYTFLKHFNISMHKMSITNKKKNIGSKIYSIVQVILFNYIKIVYLLFVYIFIKFICYIM